MFRAGHGIPILRYRIVFTATATASAYRTAEAWSCGLRCDNPKILRDRTVPNPGHTFSMLLPLPPHVSHSDDGSHDCAMYLSAYSKTSNLEEDYIRSLFDSLVFILPRLGL